MNLAYDSIYYRQTAPGFKAEALATDISVDVCIIGAGFAGLATALGLAERGQNSVALLEAHNVGHGASGRNGGFVFGGFSLGSAELIKAVGIEHARELYQGTLNAVQLIRQRALKYQIECEINESGVLLANWFDDEKRLDDIQSFMRESFGVEWQRLSREQTQEQIHSERYFGALWERNAFHFHPLKYAQGCALQLTKMGVQIFEQSRATQITKLADGYQVRTANAVVHCKVLVVSCGGYIEQLVPAFSKAVMPIATYVMVTEPLGARLTDVMKTSAAVYDTRFAFDYYRPLNDGRLLWGGRISIKDRAPEQVAKLLQKDVAKVFPSLAHTKIDYAWSGLMSYATHQMPQLGKNQDGIWFGMGFGGHGVGPTTMAGDELAKAILGQTELPWGFSKFGLTPTFGRAGLFTAQCNYWWLQAKDWWYQ